MKFEPNAHLNLFCQQYKAENLQLNILGNFLKKTKKKVKKSIFFVMVNFHHPHEFTPYWYKKMSGKNYRASLLYMFD